MRLERSVLAATVILATACVHTNAVVLNPTAERAPTCDEAVELFTSAGRVGQPYEEIAVLNSSGESGWTDEEGMYESQRRKAADLGANGLILSGINEPNAGTKIIGALFGTGAERKGSAVAIWIPGDTTRVKAACRDEELS